MAEENTPEGEVLDPFVGGDGREETAMGSPEDRGDYIPEEELVAEPTPDSTPDSEAEEIKQELAAEAEPEPTPEPEPEPTPEVNAHIPKARLDMEVAKRRALEERVKTFERTQMARASAEQNRFDFDSKEADYMDAVLDGDKDKAMSIRQEIRIAEETQYQSAAAQVQESAVSVTREQLEFDGVVNQAINHYPELDVNAANHSEQLLNMTNTMFAGYTQQGYTRADAMKMAVNDVMGMQTPAALGESSPEPAPAPVPTTVQTEVPKKVEAAAKQPPATQTMGEGDKAGASDLPDITRMTDDELMSFAQKNPAKWAEMRGDTF